MRVVFFVVGTHGDAVPIAALGRAMLERGHEVVVATSRDHRPLMEANGLTWSDLSPSYADEIARVDGRLGEGSGAGMRFLRSRMLIASGQWAEQARRAATGAGLLVGAGLAMGAVACAIGEALGIKAVGAGVMPLTPTRAFPPPVPPPTRMPLPGLVNLGLAWTVRELVWRTCFAEAIGRLRDDLGLARWQHGRLRMLYNFSPALLPQPPDWPPARIRVTGSWTLPEPNRATPDPKLRRFVEDGDVPVVIGFGSMRVDPSERARLSARVSDMVRQSGRRAVVIRGWGALDPDPDERMMVVDHAPLDWLLPRVAAVVHHGGAGTVAAAARAGVPQVIVPFVADQFFWAWQLRRLGVSPGALPRATLSAANLAKAIAACMTMRAAAERVGTRMARENGVADAIAGLEQWGLLR